jgi:hypothetical protein
MGTLTVTVPFENEELTRVPLNRAVAFLQFPHEIENLQGFWKFTPSCEHPAEEAMAYRGETPIPGAETTTLPGGKIVTIVIAGAGCEGGVGTRPVPVNGKLSGLLDASDVIVTAADLLPAVNGEKTTFQVQVPDARTVPQVFPLMENSLAFVPVRVMLEIVSVAVPVLVNTTAVGELEVPSS